MNKFGKFILNRLDYFRDKVLSTNVLELALKNKINHCYPHEFNINNWLSAKHQLPEYLEGECDFYCFKNRMKFHSNCQVMFI